MYLIYLFALFGNVCSIRLYNLIALCIDDLINLYISMCQNFLEYILLCLKNNLETCIFQNITMKLEKIKFSKSLKLYT